MSARVICNLDRITWLSVCLLTSPGDACETAVKRPTSFDITNDNYVNRGNVFRHRLRLVVWLSSNSPRVRDLLHHPISHSHSH